MIDTFSLRSYPEEMRNGKYVRNEEKLFIKTRLYLPVRWSSSPDAVRKRTVVDIQILVVANIALVGTSPSLLTTVNVFVQPMDSGLAKRLTRPSSRGHTFPPSSMHL